MAFYLNGSSTVYDIRKQHAPLQSFLASSESVEDLSQQHTLKERKLVQLDKVLYMWFIAMCSKGKPVTGPIII
jgi:hypothetical protein